MKSESTGKRPQSTGFGESRPHAAAKGEFDRNRLLDCHVGKVLVSDLPLPVQQGIVYANTDEGIEERLAALEAKGRLDKGPRAQITREDWDNEVGTYEDFNERAGSAARDPFRTLMDDHVPAGFSGKMMAKGALKTHGKRGYITVPDPVSGMPIERGNMILGVKPTEIRDAEKARVLKRAHEQRALPEQHLVAEVGEQHVSREGIPLAEARNGRSLLDRD